MDKTVFLEKALQTIIAKHVSEKLHGIACDFNDFIKKNTSSKDEAQEAGLVILEMMKNATSEYFIKMEKRAQVKSV